MAVTTQMRPRLNPEAKLAMLHCYSRPDPIMTNYVSRMRFLRFTLMNKRSCSTTHIFMRRCSIRDLGQSNGFELSFQGSGASIRLSDQGLFATMELVRPQRFRLCAIGSNTTELECAENGLSGWILSLKEFLAKSLFKLADKEELRTRRLVELSTGTTGLVVGSLSLAFVPLIEKIALHLNHLECDAELLELAKICEPMQLSTFVASQHSKTISLRTILQHQIRRLDLCALSIKNECQFESNLPCQPALRQLCIRSPLEDMPKALKFYKNLQEVAPNLNQLELHLSTDIDLSNKGQQISDKVEHIFDRLQQFGKQCRAEMQKLALHFTAYFSMVENSTYEKHWRKNLKQHLATMSIENIELVDNIESIGSVEKLQLRLTDDFLCMIFGVELRKYREIE